jgi:DNA-binding transcriptional MerR regulator
MEKLLPAIPAKRYFTIGEVGDLCGVKPHVLRYWEQEFNQLRPMKRRGNRRYYQHHEVIMIRRIRDLLYDQGFTISGARNKIQELIQAERDHKKIEAEAPSINTELDCLDATPQQLQLIRRELQEISVLLQQNEPHNLIDGSKSPAGVLKL